MRLTAVLAFCGLALWGGVSFAQSTAAPAQPNPVPVASALLTLDEERLFAGSAFGKEVLARQDAEAQKLTAENRRIEAALEEEEKSLTARRATMTREEFTPLADAFNVKVVGIRSAQNAKSRDLARSFDTARQQMLAAVRPVLAAVLTERGAVAIIDKRAVFAGFDEVDITDDVIARLDALHAAGTLAPTTP
jgi:Skp family chaperone for outer membrane proteins